jgi:hypothetical protein
MSEFYQIIAGQAICGAEPMSESWLYRLIERLHSGEAARQSSTGPQLPRPQTASQTQQPS